MVGFLGTGMMVEIFFIHQNISLVSFILVISRKSENCKKQKHWSFALRYFWIRPDHFVLDNFTEEIIAAQSFTVQWRVSLNKAAQDHNDTSEDVNNHWRYGCCATCVNCAQLRSKFGDRLILLQLFNKFKEHKTFYICLFGMSLKAENKSCEWVGNDVIMKEMNSDRAAFEYQGVERLSGEIQLKLTPVLCVSPHPIFSPVFPF